MAWLAGVDGCPRGWFRICRDTASGELAFGVLDSVSALVTERPRPTVVALDMPLGLPVSGARACDRAARACLGPRRTSVFPAPVRAALAARSREEASGITRRVDGRGVSAQAWAIYRKIRQADAALASSAPARRAIREVHPELSFWAWNGRRPMRWSKRRPEGLRERVALAEGWLGEGIVERARGERPRRDLADDDIVDAIAGLWTAHRIAEGTAETLPPSPPRDPTGLRMEIVF
jgi:predicted RNase H-like nuclease